MLQPKKPPIYIEHVFNINYHNLHLNLNIVGTTYT